MFPIEKLLRDMRLLKIYEGTSEIQRQVVSGFVLNHYQPVMPPLEDLPIQREYDPADIEKMKKNGQQVWRCRICGHVHVGEAPPEHCPYCFFPQKAFKQC
jgi:acyl-CoA dehydrogenase